MQKPNFFHEKCETLQNILSSFTLLLECFKFVQLENAHEFAIGPKLKIEIISMKIKLDIDPYQKRSVATAFCHFPQK